MGLHRPWVKSLTSLIRRVCHPPLTYPSCLSSATRQCRVGMDRGPSCGAVTVFPICDRLSTTQCVQCVTFLPASRFFTGTTPALPMAACHDGWISCDLQSHSWKETVGASLNDSSVESLLSAFTQVLGLLALHQCCCWRGRHCSATQQ